MSALSHSPLVPDHALSPRERVLRTASALFYREGARAVGMELIVERSGVAKTTIYRHFPTKDALIEAFLEREDSEFWAQWDAVAGPHRADPLAALSALAWWVGERVSRDHYRGCPQINIAAEFADRNHPAQQVAHRHKTEMTNRLTALCRGLDEATAAMRGQQIGLLFDGAFTSGGRIIEADPGAVLADAVLRLVGSSTKPV